MNSVWIVTAGNYDEFHIDDVFASEEAAVAALEARGLHQSPKGVWVKYPGMSSYSSGNTPHWIDEHEVKS